MWRSSDHFFELRSFWSAYIREADQKNRSSGNENEAFALSFPNSSPLPLSFFLFHFTIPLLKKLTTFYFVRKFFGKTSRIVRLDGRKSKGGWGGGGRFSWEFLGLFMIFAIFLFSASLTESCSLWYGLFSRVREEGQRFS